MVNVVQELGDLELAVLVCLVADQHCIIKAPEELLDDVEAEIGLIATRRFGLQSKSLECSRTTSVEEFSDAVVVDENDREDEVRSPTLYPPLP